MIKTLYPTFRKWSENGSVWLIGDTHFDDMDRDAMGYSITENEQIGILKKRCGKNDTLIHLGDVGNPEYLRVLKCRKILIMGNHDQSVSKFSDYFDETFIGPLVIADKIILSHEPLHSLPFFLNIHGHDHNPENVGDAHHLNLASNVCGYEPANLSTIIKSGVLKNIRDIHRTAIDEAIERKKTEQEKTARETGGGKCRQLIIVRKDLKMSPGKLAAQTAHASIAFMTNWIRCHTDPDGMIDGRLDDWSISWINGIFTKTVCEAKNRKQLEKAIAIANGLGLEEGRDFFLIKDNCLTELEPEEFDENGVGRTLTCIGFRPLPDDLAHTISRKYHLYI